MRFPRVIKHRKAEAKIYGKSKSYPFYRVAGYVGGKRRMESHRTYAEALAAAEKLAREVAAGSQVLTLTPGQANDALAALQCLDALKQATGIGVTLLAAVTEYAESARKLKQRSLAQAVAGAGTTKPRPGHPLDRLQWRHRTGGPPPRLPRPVASPRISLLGRGLPRQATRLRRGARPFTELNLIKNAAAPPTPRPHPLPPIEAHAANVVRAYTPETPSQCAHNAAETAATLKTKYNLK